MSYSIAFPHPVIGAESLDFTPSAGSYENDVAPARTFGFLAEVEMLLKSGLVKGGSLENVVVLDQERVMNPEGLRFPDEFCRHKILDLIGDISLFGHPLIGHVVADRAGHAMHAQLVSQLLRQKDCWTLTTDPPCVRPFHFRHRRICSGRRIVALISTARRPAIGKSARRRGYRLWTRSETPPQEGHAPLMLLARIVMTALWTSLDASAAQNPGGSNSEARKDCMALIP